MKRTILSVCLVTILLFGFTGCNEANRDLNAGRDAATGETTMQQQNQQLAHGGFASQIEHGKHLVLSIGCHDCHTPKVMTENGPEPDMALALSGHPAQMPPPDVNRADMERKGLTVSDQFTAWVGPWGISYAANLTSDPTGIGNWQEQNFITSIREGKHKGIASARTVLPPMPWPMYKNLTDEELKAIFAYLKSTKPIKNVVPPPAPPVTASAAQ